MTRAGAWVAALLLFCAGSGALDGYLTRFHLGVNPESDRVLIVGDSHAVTGLDPRLWEGGRSMALSAEPLMLTTLKLRTTLPHLPNLEAVVLAVGPHSLASFNDLRLSGDRSTNILFERLEGVVDFGELSDDVEVAGEILFASRLRSWWAPNPHLLMDWWERDGPPEARLHSHSEGFRRFSRAPQLSQEKLASTILRHFPDTIPPVSPIQTAYLDSIAAVTREAGVQLVLVSTPLHPDYRDVVPPPLFRAFDSQLTRLDGDPAVTVLRLETTVLPDTLFQDFDHINAEGARALQPVLAEALRDSQVGRLLRQGGLGGGGGPVGGDG